MVLRLIVANAGIWLVMSFLVNIIDLERVQKLVDGQLALLPQAVLTEGKIWQVFTYSWLHDMTGASHIIFNMLGLFFLGPPLERRWGPKAFLWFYVFSGAIAGVVTVAAGLAAPDLFGARVVGASGAIMAVVAAFSLVLPNGTILLFFVLPVQARWILWIAVGIDTAMFVTGGSAIAWHTHMGGVLAAWLLITGNWRPRLALDRLRLFFMKSRRKGRRVDLRILDGGRDDDDMLN